MRTLALIASLALSFSAWADQVQLREDAPNRHVVVKGDTLWDISAKFLKTPWKWPELWQLNKEEIKNPHLIYPGDVILLTYVNGQPKLSRLETVKLTPQVRAEPLGQMGIPSVPFEAMAPFLNQTRIIDSASLERMPYILGSNQGRVMYSTHDQVYATTTDVQAPAWQVVRVARPLVDPDNGEVLGYELEHLGHARTLKPGTTQLLLLTHTDREVLERDRLVPEEKGIPTNYAPHAPEQPLMAKVITLLGGGEGAGPYTTIVLNKGAKGGLEPGHVLDLSLPGRSTDDPKCKRAQSLAFMAGGFQQSDGECKDEGVNRPMLPNKFIGQAFVYQVFDQVAYALVMHSTEPVYPNTLVSNPRFPETVIEVKIK